MSQAEHCDTIDLKANSAVCIGGTTLSSLTVYTLNILKTIYAYSGANYLYNS